MHSKFMRGGAALSATTLAVAVLAGCSSDDGGNGGNGDNKAKGGEQEQRTPAQTIAAVTEKTEEAQSAKVDMTMTLPGEAGGEMQMSGVMGWQPLAMDLTMSGEALAQEPDAPEEIRMLWLDEIMYMDMGAEAAKELDGKQWMKIDPKAIAEQSDDPDLVDGMTMGMEEQNQNPSQQMAMLLDSPDIKKVGEETIDGVATEHYAGTVSLEEAMKSDKSLEYLGEKERQGLVDSMKKDGIEEYDVDLWVNDEDYPVRLKQSYDSNEGPTDVRMDFSDYGTKVSAEAPPASETFDMLEMMEQQGAA